MPIVGVPQSMDFDISASSFILDIVRVVGNKASHDDEKWSARFELKKARAIDDEHGEAIVNIVQDHIEIPYAFATSDKIDIGTQPGCTERT